MQKRKSQMGKKAGSAISNPIDLPTKSKSKKPKKQSKGKQKR